MKPQEIISPLFTTETVLASIPALLSLTHREGNNLFAPNVNHHSVNMFDPCFLAMKKDFINRLYSSTIMDNNIITAVLFKKTKRKTTESFALSNIVTSTTIKNASADIHVELCSLADYSAFEDQLIEANAGSTVETVNGANITSMDEYHESIKSSKADVFILGIVDGLHRVFTLHSLALSSWSDISTVKSKMSIKLFLLKVCITVVIFAKY